jgi:hypothetical protein
MSYFGLKSTIAADKSGAMFRPSLIAFSVHRWQAHLLDEGAIARVGMEKVESGVGLSQQ